MSIVLQNSWGNSQVMPPKSTSGKAGNNPNSLQLLERVYLPTPPIGHYRTRQRTNAGNGSRGITYKVPNNLLAEDISRSFALTQREIHVHIQWFSV